MDNSRLKGAKAFPLPLHHTSTVKEFDDLHASFTARVLVLRRPDGTAEIYLPFVQYQREFRLRSRSWQDHAARGLGLFWDFCVAHGDTGWAPTVLLREFAYALLEGTLDAKHPASRSLMWPAVGRVRAEGLVRHVEDFAEWCSSKDDSTSPVAPTTTPLVPGTGEHATRLLVWSRLRRISMLQHIKRVPVSWKKSHVEFGRNDKGREMRPAKHFPPAFAERLLWEGHRRPRAVAGQNVFLEYCARDIMIALLDGWGGLRRSEGLHLWESDVIEHPGQPDHAFVVLNHPEQASVQWIDPVSGSRRRGTRQHMLAETYGLRPRNLVTRGHYHVGWKGMALNDDLQACIFWIDPTAGALFWTLYQGYCRFVRPSIMAERFRLGGRDHPFLFVSEEVNPVTGLPGEPYSERAYERNHEAAVLRLGLEHSKRAGTTTHGLRHLYGHTMRKLGVHPHVIRQGLHHINLLSQVIYTAPLPEDVDAALRHAQQMAATKRVAIAPLAEDTTQELIRLRLSLSHGGSHE
ncbi:hypothetical protein [Bradyrhizobium sp. F1.13.3]|uniref:hypothetical protein n=1 Tax=Bradyrhizobium sp. F1.13.3 TaxID=3156351 RepID=UPI003397B346